MAPKVDIRESRQETENVQCEEGICKKQNVLKNYYNIKK